MDRLEKCLEGWEGPARRLVNKSYERVVKAIFLSVENIAKSEAQEYDRENKDKDDKELLNAHILTIGRPLKLFISWTKNYR